MCNASITTLYTIRSHTNICYIIFSNINITWYSWNITLTIRPVHLFPNHVFINATIVWSCGTEQYILIHLYWSAHTARKKNNTAALTPRLYLSNHTTNSEPCLDFGEGQEIARKKVDSSRDSLAYWQKIFAYIYFFCVYHSAKERVWLNSGKIELRPWSTIYVYHLWIGRCDRTNHMLSIWFVCKICID